MKRSGVRGFGLLEAIVALVLLAATGGALFAWLAQTTRDFGRADEAQERAKLSLRALALLEAINPNTEPVGERRVGDLTVSWRAELIEPVRTSVPTQAMQPVRWRVGLYRLQAEVRRGADGLSESLQVTLPGLEDVGAARDGVARLVAQP